MDSIPNAFSWFIYDAIGRGKDIRKDGSEYDPGKKVWEIDYGLHGALKETTAYFIQKQCYRNGYQ